MLLGHFYALMPEQTLCRAAPNSAALRALLIRKAEIALGRFGLIPKADVPTFEMFADRYLELVSYHKRGYRLGVHGCRTGNPTVEWNYRRELWRFRPCGA